MAQTKKAVTTQAPVADLHEVQRLHLRIVFVIVLGVWTFAALATPVVVFCLTRNPLSFSLFSTLAPPVYLWLQFAKYVLMDERIFELDKLKIEVKAQRKFSSRNKIP